MTVTQGPVVEFKRKPRQLTPRFLKLLDELQRWRNADHEETYVLCRYQVCELIDGIDTLVEAAKTPKEG